MPERKRFLLRLDPAIYDAVERWAGDDLRSVNAQIEHLLADALRRAGRTPRQRSPQSDPVTAEDASDERAGDEG